MPHQPKQAKPHAGARSHATDRRLDVEELEPRRVLATFTVTNDLDGPVSATGSLPGSLRQAIFDANQTMEPDDIVFDAEYFSTPRTIQLQGDDIEIYTPMSITGPGAKLLTIDAGDGEDNLFATGDGYRIFSINSLNPNGFEYSDLIRVELRRMTLTGGDARFAGAILTSEDTELSEVEIIKNAGVTDEDSYGFGAIFASAISAFGGGRLTIRDSTVAENAQVIDSNVAASLPAFTAGDSAAITLFGGSSLRIANSTVSSNFGVAGIAVFGGLVEIVHSTITDNTGPDFRRYPATEEIASTVPVSVGPVGLAALLGTQDTPVEIALNHVILSGNGSGAANSYDLFFDDDNYFGFGFVDASHSLIGTRATGSALAGGSSTFVLSGIDPTVVADPVLGPLADNGGPTRTHEVLSGSPALDAGDVGSPAFWPLTFDPLNFTGDQRGDRFVRNANGLIDIGAYERQVAPALPGDYNLSGTVDAADYTLWRDSLGQEVTAYTAADGDGDAVVTSADRDVWVDHFGLSAATSTASAAPPAAEPPATAAEELAVTPPAFLPLSDSSPTARSPRAAARTVAAIDAAPSADALLLYELLDAPAKRLDDSGARFSPIDEEKDDSEDPADLFGSLSSDREGV